MEVVGCFVGAVWVVEWVRLGGGRDWDWCGGGGCGHALSEWSAMLETMYKDCCE